MCTGNSYHQGKKLYISALETAIIRKNMIKRKYTKKSEYSVSPYLALTKLLSPLKAMVLTRGYYASS